MSVREGFERFCADYDVSVCVLSRDRADILPKYTDKLVSNYRLFHCADSPGYAEAKYRGCIEKIPVPPELTGRSMVANHVMRLVDSKILIILPDDIKAVLWLGEDRIFHLDRDAFMVMCMNLVVNALDLNVGLFGINENQIKQSSPLAPFHFRAMVTGFVGLNRTVPGKPIWFDERQKVKEDYDFALEHLKRDRFVLKDWRYFFSQDRNVLRGGNMPFRTVAREDAEAENLKRWWGEDMIRTRDGHQTKRLTVLL